MIRTHLLTIGICATLLCGAADYASAQENRAQAAQADSAWLRLGFVQVDPSFFRPAGRLFFDAGRDDENEVDLFKDGKLGFTLDMLGFDIYRSFNAHTAKIGLEMAVGIGTVSDGDGTSAGALMSSGGLFLELARMFRIEVGGMWGLSAREGLTRKERDDTATFVGVVFPTTLGEVIKDLIGRR